VGGRSISISAYAVGSWAMTALMRRPRSGGDSRGPPAAATRRETGRTGVAPRETEDGALWWLGEEERNERKAAAAWAAVAMAGEVFGGFFLAWIGPGRDRAD